MTTKLDPALVAAHIRAIHVALREVPIQGRDEVWFAAQNALDALRAMAEAPALPDKGPWSYYKSPDGSDCVASGDFNHDALLVVTGDFAEGEREAYCKALAARLNEAPAPEAGAVSDAADKCATGRATISAQS